MASLVPFLVARLQGFGTTIFAEMSALAVETGAINLGQGFPDTDGPEVVLEAAVEAIRTGGATGANQYPPGPGAPVSSVLLAPGEDGAYHFDPDELRAAVTPRTKVLLLNTPHNPTGKVFDAAELAEIAELAVEHDLIVVADEVYEHLVFPGARHVPIATLPGMAERTLTISSGGKTFNTTGWKIGWLCGPAPIVAAAKAAKQFLTYVSGAPFH